TPPGHSTTPFSAQISPATETNQQVNRSHSSRPAERGKSQVIIGAPFPLRDKLALLTKRTLVNTRLGLRPETDELRGPTSDPDGLLRATLKTSLRDPARRWRALNTEITARSLSPQATAPIASATRQPSPHPAVSHHSPRAAIEPPAGVAAAAGTERPPARSTSAREIDAKLPKPTADEPQLTRIHDAAGRTREHRTLPRHPGRELDIRHVLQLRVRPSRHPAIVPLTGHAGNVRTNRVPNAATTPPEAAHHK
ncbi:hypothetical protein SAMN06265360_1321, partial [Haloechinothrix alba]